LALDLSASDGQKRLLQGIGPVDRALAGNTRAGDRRCDQELCCTVGGACNGEKTERIFSRARERCLENSGDCLHDRLVLLAHKSLAASPRRRRPVCHNDALVSSRAVG
jgi:hypothetical protein